MKTNICQATSAHLAVSASIAIATALAGFATMKVYLPAHVHWLIVLLALAPAFWWIRQNLRGSYRALMPRFFLPWVAFIAVIAFVAVWNQLAPAQVAFSLFTISKFLLMGGLLALLLKLRPNPQTIEQALFWGLVLSAMGFTLALLHDKWLIRYGDNRLGWTWAWAGAFWKTAIYALPFPVWRSLQTGSWRLFPHMLLAMTVLALDSSRAALLVATMVLANGLVLHWHLGTGRRSLHGLAPCGLAMLMAYCVLQPSVMHLAATGATGKAWAALTMTVLVAWSIHALLHPSRKALTAGMLLALGITVLPFYLSADVRSEMLPLVGQRLAGGDSVRMAMLQEGINTALQNFPFGGGLGTTKGDDMGRVADIHMTYLQLLSDVGILGLLTYLGIFAVFFQCFLRMPQQQQRVATPLVAIMMTYLCAGLFVPFANELSDWFPVLLAFAALHALDDSQVTAPKVGAQHRFTNPTS